MEYFTLRNGIRLSCIGMGTYPMHSYQLLRTVPFIGKTGINLIDTAHDYKNESAIGLANKLGLNRNMYLSTKMSVSQQRQGGGNVEPSLMESMRKLNAKGMGMYLLHFPYPETYLDCWREIERLYKNGCVACIGVCNCNIHHLKAIIEHCEIVPFINQVECHPYFAQQELLDFCRENGIQMEAYSPFARNLPDMIYNPVLTGIAAKYGKAVHQVILRWDFQRGIIALPKAASLQKIRQNTEIFDFALTKQDMSDIQTLDKGFRVRFNPDTVDYTRF